MRGTAMLASVVQAPVAGFQSSAGRTAPAASLKVADVEPPVASTVPSGSTVALKSRRAERIAPVGCQAGLPPPRSMTSQVLTGATLLDLAPPAYRIFPGSYMTAEPLVRGPNLCAGPFVHFPVPEVSRKRVCTSGPASKTEPSGATKIFG